MKLRILIVEDNEQNRYLLTYLLRHAGHQVFEAADGPAGLALSRACDPDLIILDIQLPGMDGYQVARSIRERPALARVPILAVSSFAMPGDRERALAAGCTDYIEKPIEPLAFEARLALLVSPAEHGHTGQP